MHLMIDLETLSLAPNAIVTEIGAITFDIHMQDLILDQKSWQLDIAVQVKMKRHMDHETIIWWMKQSDAARRKMYDAQRMAVNTALEEFETTFDWPNIEGIWSHGLNFDIPILEDLIKQWGKKVPWHYRTPRDTRTLFWLAGGVKPEGHVVAHSAIDDCIAQARAVQRAFGILSAGLPAGKF
jgi:hypothetical protein